MELIRGLYNFKKSSPGYVATIGNFDGMHLGHQALMRRLTHQAKLMQLPSLVILFEPHPREYFNAMQAPARLTLLREKLLVIKQFDIDEVLCLRFNEKLATLSAEFFVQQILHEKLRIRYLIIGDDFRFGQARRGDFNLLQKMAPACDFQVAAMDSVKNAGDRVSSTAIREALKIGDLAKAERLLGRTFSMCGYVAHGQKRGRSIGFPTANIYLHRKVTPLHGVYAVKLHELDPEPLFGVANVGTRPTVDGTRTLLEVHLFNFNRDIYSKHVRVDFIHKLRDEKKFDSFDLLKLQIVEDAEQARRYFSI